MNKAIRTTLVVRCKVEVEVAGFMAIKNGNK